MNGGSRPKEAKGYEILDDIKCAQNDLGSAIETYKSAMQPDEVIED